MSASRGANQCVTGETPYLTCLSKNHKREKPTTCRQDFCTVCSYGATWGGGTMSLSEDTVAQSSTAPLAPVRHSSPLGPISEWISVERLVDGSERRGGMLVRSVQFKRLFASITRFAPHKATVLIQGESGTGKELVARSLHSLGAVPNGPFVTFNCSNLVDSLAESQLFGHVKGAFTDAREDSLGYFRSANGGTLFLDEIGELPLKLQPKLLRAVENREVQPVGSAREYQIDIQLVCATNRDLRAMMKAGTFREDLYYRLNSTTITLPPLRERTPAIPGLVGHFAAHYGQMFNKTIRFISRAALDQLCGYQWPGNIRQLAHVIESAVMMTDADRISLAALPAEILPEHRVAPIKVPFGDPECERVVVVPSAHAPAEKSSMQLDDVIKETVLRSIQHTGGNRRRAADLLGISRSTLYRMLARYGLDESAKRELGSNLDNYAL